MVFNSFTFGFFLVALLGFYILPLAWNARKFILLAASYIFYAAWNPPFVILLLISTLADWFLARVIYRALHPGVKHWALAGSLLVNLGLLGYFKYAGFILENFKYLVDLMGVQIQLAAPNVILPVGISFYTFQTLSYTLDIYKGKSTPSTSFLDYALYVTFFPQLVAGPIVRAAHFLPQCSNTKLVRKENLGMGLVFLTVGLFEKIVLADNLFAPCVEAVFTHTGQLNFISSWMGTIAFAGQIFCDFAGYSTCAIGVALILGFELPVNFRFPYAACGFSDFWQRWHISLSTWIRDYIYIPLGGNRKGGGRTVANLGVTMFLGGLWHGASWTFVIWGLLHGLLLIFERMAVGLFGHWKWWDSKMSNILLTFITFVAICLTWVFFRSTSLPQAIWVLKGMVNFNTQGAYGVDYPLMVLSGITMAVLYLYHNIFKNLTLPQIVLQVPKSILVCAMVLMVGGLFTCSGEDSAFIYFQF